MHEEGGGKKTEYRSRMHTDRARSQKCQKLAMSANSRVAGRATPLQGGRVYDPLPQSPGPGCTDVDYISQRNTRYSGSELDIYYICYVKSQYRENFDI